MTEAPDLPPMGTLTAEEARRRIESLGTALWVLAEAAALTTGDGGDACVCAGTVRDFGNAVEALAVHIRGVWRRNGTGGGAR